MESVNLDLIFIAVIFSNSKSQSDPCGLVDKASVSEAGDRGFESCQG